MFSRIPGSVGDSSFSLWGGSLTARTATALHRLGRGGQIVGWITREESRRLEQETDVSGRHDRVVFGPRKVRVTHRGPEDHIGVRHRTVLLGPLDESVTALVLVGIIPGCEFFIGLIRRDPDMMIHEAGALAPAGGRGGVGQTIISRDELVELGPPVTALISDSFIFSFLSTSQVNSKVRSLGG